MTSEKLTKEQREKILKIANDLDDTIAWSKTKEGVYYWLNVQNALYRIATSNVDSNIKKCPKCGEVLEE